MNFYFQALELGLALSSLSMGIFISMKIFNIPDITTDGSYTLGAVVAGVCMVKGLPLGMVFLFSFLASALAGSITGFISTYLKVNALLSGILVMTALYSINITLLGRANLPLIQVKNIFNSLGPFQDSPKTEFWVLLILVTLIAFLVIILLKTDFGIAMRATGNSETMVRSMGVNTSRLKIMGLAMANGLIGISGCLVAQYQGYVDISMGIGIIIAGLGSVGLSDALLNYFSMPKVSFRVIGVIIGTLIFQSLLALSINMGIDPNLLKLVSAVLVLAVVSLPLIKFKYS